MVQIKFTVAMLASVLAVASATSNTHRRVMKRNNGADLVSIFEQYQQPAPAVQERALANNAFTTTGSSQNDVDCSDLELVYIRSGNEGQARMGLLGDPLYAEMLKLKPQGLSAYNVMYDASMWELFGSSTAGSDDATKHISTMAAKCPKQRYAVVGYSKGTLVAHQVRAATPDIAKRLVAVSVIGDALNKFSPLPPGFTNATWPVDVDRVKALCNMPDDIICAPNGLSMDAHVHTAYIGQMPALAKWIIDQYNKHK